MSEQKKEQQTTQNQDQGDKLPPARADDELTLLKRQARAMGIPFSNNIGVETLRAKIKAVMEGEAEKEKTLEDQAAEALQKKPKKLSLRERLRRENLALVRVRVTNLDPKERDLPGEIFTVANEYVGTVRKYVHFNVPWHVPKCIYKMMRNAKFLNIRVYKQAGREIVETSWAPKYSIEVLPQLTKEELQKLAVAQRSKGL